MLVIEQTPPLLLPTSLLTIFVSQTPDMCVAEVDMSKRALRLVYLLLCSTSTAASRTRFTRALDAMQPP